MKRLAEERLNGMRRLAKYDLGAKAAPGMRALRELLGELDATRADLKGYEEWAGDAVAAMATCASVLGQDARIMQELGISKAADLFALESRLRALLERKPR